MIVVKALRRRSRSWRRNIRGERGVPARGGVRDEDLDILCKHVTLGDERLRCLPHPGEVLLLAAVALLERGARVMRGETLRARCGEKARKPLHRDLVVGRA